MKPEDEAGRKAFRASHWNNVEVNAKSGLKTNLVKSDGSGTTAKVSFKTDLGGWKLPIRVSDSDDRMWKGYLDVGTEAEVKFTDLPFTGEYRLVVYMDGDNQSGWSKCRIEAGGDGAWLEDSENTNWGQGDNVAKVYQLPVIGGVGNRKWPVAPGEPNNIEGNYIVLSGMKGSELTISVKGEGRAPVNGIQLVAEESVERSSEVKLGDGQLVLRRKGAK